MRRLGIIIASLAIVFAGVASAAPAMAGAHWRHHHPVINPLRPEQFDIILANDSGGTNVNSVNARGPVYINAGSDTTITNFLDHFNSGPGDRVNVLHAPLPTPEVDLRTCTVRYTLTDAPWRFIGGTGAFLRARGFGVFDLNAEFSFAAPRGRCVLIGLSTPHINRLIQFGSTRLILSADVFVQGTGVASVQRRNTFAPVTPAVSTPAAA